VSSGEGHGGDFDMGGGDDMGAGDDFGGGGYGGDDDDF
jgi:hypothetical protein